MYYTVLLLSIATCVILVTAVFMILRMEATVGQQYMFGYVICSLVQNVAYLFELLAGTPGEAMMAIRMRYFGATYVVIFLCEYSYYALTKRQAKNFFQALAAVCTLLVAMLWAGDQAPLFFRDCIWIEQAGHPYYKLYYGWGFYLWALCSCVLPCLIIILLLVQYFRSGHSEIGKNRLVILTAIAAALPVLRILYVFESTQEFDFYPLSIGCILAIATVLLFRGSTNDLSQLSVGRMTDRMSEVVLIVDDLGNIIDCNASARHMLGDDILTKTVGDKFESIRRLDPKELNCSYKIKDKFYESRVESIQAKNGQVIGYLILLYETTELHETMELLTTLKERAEDANTAKSTFLSNMSHEIRTPMNTIVGITEILQDRIQGQEEREYLANIRTSGNTLLSIINDILDFSKIENGDLELHKTEYDLLSILHDLGIMFLNQIGSRPIDLLFDVEKELPAKLVGDSVRLRQVIINILNNAVKYTEEGYIRLQIRSRMLEDGRCELSVAVTDSGIGIKEEDIGRVFENFTRVDEEHNNAKEGTGLGLAIAKNIVERMGGHIGVNSVYGMGTRFSFTVIQEYSSERKAAVDLSGEKGRNVCAHFASSRMLSILKELLEMYNMNFIPYGEQAHVDYFFVDTGTYEQVRNQFSQMREEGTKVILLQNPMEPHASYACDAVCHMPLYSLSFANALHGEQTEEKRMSNLRSYIAPGARVLIVDDNEMNLKVAKGLLQPLQMTIETAENGKEAIRKVEQDAEYDLILMDHMMPVMDGVEATKILRSRGEDYMRTVPIIALTANAIVGVKEMFLEAGMNDMVAKPIDLPTLYRKLYNYLPKELIIDMGDTMKFPEPAMSGASSGGYSSHSTSGGGIPHGSSMGGTFGSSPADPGTDAAASGSKDDMPEIPGINIKKGIAYCQNFEFLCEMFGDFCAGIENKTALITQYLGEENYRDYTVEVHGLKGTSRMIGASDLGEEFYELEKFGKANDLEGMKKRTPEVLADYRAMGEVLALHCKS